MGEHVAQLETRIGSYANSTESGSISDEIGILCNVTRATTSSKLELASSPRSAHVIKR
jgi:hypothetical protein